MKQEQREHLERIIEAGLSQVQYEQRFYSALCTQEYNSNKRVQSAKFQEYALYRDVLSLVLTSHGL